MLILSSEGARRETTHWAMPHCNNDVGGTWGAAPRFKIEATSYRQNTNNCVTDSSAPEARQPISHLRFVWDVFDSNQDGPFDNYSSGSNGDWVKQATIFTRYSSGTGLNQLDEPWNSNKTSVTEPDGRGSAFFAANYAGIRDVSAMRTRNCSPP